jgi:hypothetical protein
VRVVGAEEEKECVEREACGEGIFIFRSSYVLSCVLGKYFIGFFTDNFA